MFDFAPVLPPLQLAFARIDSFVLALVALVMIT